MSTITFAVAASSPSDNDRAAAVDATTAAAQPSEHERLTAGTADLWRELVIALGVVL